jgi:hypothetical protein
MFYYILERGHTGKGTSKDDGLKERLPASPSQSSIGQSVVRKIAAANMLRKNKVYFRRQERNVEADER